MIHESKYEGHTEGKWEYDSATIHATAKGGNEIIAEYPCWNYNKDQLITKEEEANLRLMADAPDLLAAYKRLNVEVKELLDDMAHIVENYLRDGDPAAAVLLILDGRKTIEKITGIDAREYFARLYDEPEGDDE